MKRCDFNVQKHCHTPEENRRPRRDTSTRQEEDELLRNSTAIVFIGLYKACFVYVLLGFA